MIKTGDDFWKEVTHLKHSRNIELYDLIGQYALNRTNKNPNLSKIIQILDKLDCRMVIVPNKTDGLPFKKTDSPQQRARERISELTIAHDWQDDPKVVAEVQENARLLW